MSGHEMLLALLPRFTTNMFDMLLFSESARVSTPISGQFRLLCLPKMSPHQTVSDNMALNFISDVLVIRSHETYLLMYIYLTLYPSALK